MVYNSLMIEHPCWYTVPLYLMVPIGDSMWHDDQPFLDLCGCLDAPLA